MSNFIKQMKQFKVKAILPLVNKGYFTVRNVYAYNYQAVYGGRRGFSTTGSIEPQKLDNSLSSNEFKKISDEALEQLYELYETEEDSIIIDCLYSEGVLTIKCANDKTFVLNRQCPNKQIWYSSPVSGPMRFNYDRANNKWLNSRSEELPNVLKNDVEQLKKKK